MKTVNLPALNTKKEANTVKITNAKIEGVTPDVYDKGVTVTAGEAGGVTFEIPAELFGYNQFDSMSEAIADCGGELQALEIFNDFKRDEALNDAKVILRTTTNNDVNSVVAAALKAALDHTFSGSNKLTASEAKGIVNDLRAKAANMSAEDLKAELIKMLGL